VTVVVEIAFQPVIPNPNSKVERFMSRKQIQQTLIGVVILGVLYYMFSPQQNCIRDKSAGISIVEGKAAAEAVQAEKLKIIEECGESNAW
tara:strand:+ start:1312 stop:1581 length:270 start_codon:yes stop_codon:yes gene_type:complete